MKPVTAAAVLLLLAVTSARMFAQQPSPPAQPLLTDQVFRNLQVLKGIPVDTFFDVMGMFASSMGEDCTFCHSKDAVFRHEAFGDETPRIRRARQMIAMMNGINQANFGGRPMVTCFTCHRGSNSPVTSPKLALQYGEPEDDPNVINFPPEARPAATEILDKYLQAIGGAAPSASRYLSRISLAVMPSYAGKLITFGSSSGSPYCSASFGDVTGELLPR